MNRYSNRAYFAPEITVNWARMAQSVLRYNVVIVGEYFIKGSWVSEAWKKEHPEEIDDEAGVPPERILTAQERRERLRLDQDFVSAVCGLRARHLHTVFG